MLLAPRGANSLPKQVRRSIRVSPQVGACAVSGSRPSSACAVVPLAPRGAISQSKKGFRNLVLSQLFGASGPRPSAACNGVLPALAWALSLAHVLTYNARRLCTRAAPVSCSVPRCEICRLACAFGRCRECGRRMCKHCSYSYDYTLCQPCRPARAAPMSRRRHPWLPRSPSLRAFAKFAQALAPASGRAPLCRPTRRPLDAVAPGVLSLARAPRRLSCCSRAAVALDEPSLARALAKFAQALAPPARLAMCSPAVPLVAAGSVAASGTDASRLLLLRRVLPAPCTTVFGPPPIVLTLVLLRQGGVTAI